MENLLAPGALYHAIEVPRWQDARAESPEF
jgi:hypothetical protein